MEQKNDKTMRNLSGLVGTPQYIFEEGDTESVSMLSEDKMKEKETTVIVEASQSTHIEEVTRCLTNKKSVLGKRAPANLRESRCGLKQMKTSNYESNLKNDDNSTTANIMQMTIFADKSKAAKKHKEKRGIVCVQVKAKQAEPIIKLKSC
jgi:hypothetical protein